MEAFSLEEYLSKGTENIIRRALGVSAGTRERIFYRIFALRARKAAAIRRKSEKKGLHVPPFLIASITSVCNLHCAGCYARENGACHDGASPNQLVAGEWGRIFREAEKAGIGFVLLAGGEPLERRDVLISAAEHKNIIFPVFTNGTLLNREYITLFNKNRNLIPVFSIEGDGKETDARRGTGVYDKICTAMKKLSDKRVLFGASVTFTTENTEKVVSGEFINSLKEKGCRLIIYVEYVPVNTATKHLAPGDKERIYIEGRIAELRRTEGMLCLSFPGDEKASGGCLAAGRGFFHINSSGGVEPCPFSPYSDTNIRNISLLEALRSPLFEKLRDGACLQGGHSGGCVLFEREEEIKVLAGNGKGEKN